MSDYMIEALLKSGRRIKITRPDGTVVEVGEREQKDPPQAEKKEELPRAIILKQDVQEPAKPQEAKIVPSKVPSKATKKRKGNGKKPPRAAWLNYHMLTYILVKTKMQPILNFIPQALYGKDILDPKLTLAQIKKKYNAQIALWEKAIKSQQTGEPVKLPPYAPEVMAEYRLDPDRYLSQCSDQLVKLINQKVELKDDGLAFA